MRQAKKVVEVYNLLFPDHVEELHIGDCLFKRSNDYAKIYKDMMWITSMQGVEIDHKANFGSHQITAIAECPSKHRPAVLPWNEKNPTQLHDIAFLLTLFTGRNVFLKEWEGSDMFPLTDHRQLQFGGQLQLSLKQNFMYKNTETGQIIYKRPTGNSLPPPWLWINIGFEEGINKVLGTISTDAWQREYEKGYFLFLYRGAAHRQIIETSFISCWTIWEHIFAIKNRNWLDNKEIERMSGDKKISYILNKFFLKEINGTARKNIQRLNKTRNRLVHFGKKTDQTGYDEMDLFIRLTEQLMAIILGLSPSNAFNSFEKLEKFLAESKEKQEKINERKMET